MANAKEGREIRREQIAPTLHPFGVRHLAVQFADVRSSDDCDEQLSTAHDFIKHFANELEKSVSDYYQWTQTLGEGAFQNQLGDDVDYWRKCQERWGGGTGYKTAISGWTSSWFGSEGSKKRSEFLETALQLQWKEPFKKLDAQLSSADPEASAPTNWLQRV